MHRCGSVLLVVTATLLAIASPCSASRTAMKVVDSVRNAAFGAHDTQGEKKQPLGTYPHMDPAVPPAAYRGPTPLAQLVHECTSFVSDR